MRSGFAHARASLIRPVGRRALTAALGCLLPLGAVAALSSSAEASSPSPTAVSPSASSAASWLTKQLAAGQGMMAGLSPGMPDVGLTSDTLLSLVAAGQRQEAAFASSLAAVAGHLSGYASFPAGGTTALLAGPVAKTLFLAEVGGAQPSSFGGVNLPVTLRSLLTTSGPDAGRFSDRGTGSDTSNGFSQSFAILGLSRDPGGVPASAVSFLLAQQCPSGAFRLFYDATGGCRDNSEADPDATSVTIQALSQLLTDHPGLAAVRTARTAAAQWLAGRQQADGGLGGAGPTAGENANTTALAAIAFRETGLTAAATAAESYVAGLQLTGGTDAGAVGYDPAALSTNGRTGTIPSAGKDQWRRSTSQAILAFGLPGYDALPTVPGSPISPGTPTPAPPHQTTPTPATSATSPPVQHVSGSPAPPSSTAAGDPNAFDGSASDFASDGLDPLTDQPADGSDQPQATDSPAAATPSTSPTDSATVNAQTVLPLTHATPQAAVAPKSADGRVPSWVWILVAIVGGVGGGVVVLRLQARRATQAKS